MEAELLTLSQAAKRLKTSKQEIKRLAESGSLLPATEKASKDSPHIKVRLFSKASLDLLKGVVEIDLKYIKVCPRRRFGVELEGFGVRYEDLIDGIRDVSGGSNWYVDNDGSIEGEYSFEVKSPPICGEGGLHQVRDVCSMIVGSGGAVNSSCGLHIHHEMTDLQDKFRKKMFYLYRRAEPQIDRLMPWSRRENRNGFCQSMLNRSFGSYWDYHDRGYKVNLFAYERHGTIEFRHHSGTLRHDRVVNWIILTQKIVQRVFSIDPIVESGRPYNWSQMLSVLGLSDAVESGEVWAEELVSSLAIRRDDMDKRAKAEDKKRKDRQRAAEERTRSLRSGLRMTRATEVGMSAIPSGQDIEMAMDDQRSWAEGCDCRDCHHQRAGFVARESGEDVEAVLEEPPESLRREAEEFLRGNVERAW